MSNRTRSLPNRCLWDIATTNTCVGRSLTHQVRGLWVLGLCWPLLNWREVPREGSITRTGRFQKPPSRCCHDPMPPVEDSNYCFYFCAAFPILKPAPGLSHSQRVRNCLMLLFAVLGATLFLTNHTISKPYIIQASWTIPSKSVTRLRCKPLSHWRT